ncbi:MAG: hypothetical protein MJ247_03120 [Alphaproteobacteria bacterium]|nr:hypothetical protein [Alphaproteobacteria bacterium]
MKFFQKFEYPIVILMALAVQIMCLCFFNSRYVDTDNYTHAIRVLDLLTNHKWLENIYTHTNYPFGEILHFTRLPDIFWIIASLPLFLIYPLKEAVFYGGASLQTLLLILSAISIIWSLKSTVPLLYRFLALVFYLIQPAIIETYLISKPDHHSLTTLFAIITIGGLIKALDNSKYSIIAGISASLGLWASIEGLFLTYIMLIPLLLLWCYKKLDLQIITKFIYSFTIGNFVFLCCNYPYKGFFYPDNNRLSFLYVTISIFTSVVLFVCDFIEKNYNISKILYRILLIFVLSLTSVITLFFIYDPQQILEPWFPEFLNKYWLRFVIEMQPALRKQETVQSCLIPPFISLLLSLFVYKKADQKQKKILFICFIPLLAFTIQTCYTIRFSRLASTFMFVPFVLSLNILFKSKNISEYITKRIYKNTIIICYFLAINLIFFSSYKVLFIGIQNSLYDRVERIIPALSKKEGSLLIQTTFAPDAIWRTGKNVVTAPYHSNIEGMSDEIYLFNDLNLKNVIFLLKKHQVSTIALYLAEPSKKNLLAFDWRMREYYKLFDPAKNVLPSILIRGTELPCGFTEYHPIPLPWLVYHVDFTNCPNN